ncbi:MAG: ribonuclease H-like domain-containing protein, partial [Gemmataceae bacterium]
FTDCDFKLDAGVEFETTSGRHLRLARPLAQPGSGGHWPAGVSPPSSSFPEHPEVAALARWFPRQTLFLDLETCGFAGSMVFLVGLVWHDGGTLVIDQLFARNYAEERPVLETLWSIAERCRVLVTFNGKSFDWPLVCDRSTRHHLRVRVPRREPRAGVQTSLGGFPRLAEPPSELVHCDLLHHARRRWKQVLPDCRLQTLERYVCSRVRHNDLPGALVPAAYHEYVRSGRADRVDDILRHNALDLLTLVQLAGRLASPAPAAAPGPCRSRAQ